MNDDLAPKIAAIEQMRALIGDAAADAAIAQLRATEPPLPVSPPAKPPVSMQITADNGGHVSGVKMIHAENYHEPPKDPAEHAAEQALRQYVQTLAGECNSLALGSLDSTDAATSRGVELAHVYISLNTTTRPESAARQERREGEPPPLSALAAVNDARCTMLLGAPGYGKSTFVNHLVWTLAQAWLARDPAPSLLTIPEWQHGVVVPVRIVLRDWAAAINLNEIKKGAAALLKPFLEQHLAQWHCVEALPLLWQMLHDGRAMLLLDGFDEVVGDVLPIIAGSIANLAVTCPTTRLLVTCRVLDYREEPLRQPGGFAVHTLDELTDEQIQQFISAWYCEYAATRQKPLAEMTKKADALKATLRGRAELQPLAGSPLLLTVMAIVHASRGELPDSRALLYKECIEILLVRWRQSDPSKVDVLERLQQPNVGRKELFDLMARLGFVAHDAAQRTADQRGPADLSKQQVLAVLTEGLRPFVPNEEQRDKAALTILYALAQGNGVLLQRGPTVYAFPHRTFQEFLAGYYIAGQHNKKQLVRERASQIHWHEALLLMVSYRVLESADVEFPVDVVDMLLGRDVLAQTLAGEMLLTIGHGRLESYFTSEPAEAHTRWERTTAQMLALATTRDSANVPAAQRVRAGVAHGSLAFGNVESLLTPEPQFYVADERLPFAYLDTPYPQEPWWQSAVERYWCRCDAGPFWFGAEQKKLKQVSLDDDFMIGRYPVTNAEYARFIAADGYTTRRWWTEHGWTFLQPGGHPYDDQEQPITLPRWWNDARFNQPTQPVVGVSWYEAMAYSAWLSSHLGRTVRLPTALEYERAARHTDQRPFPWGEAAPTPEHANYDQTHINQPSPIGCFPLGTAVNGASDLKGNVLEWLATAYRNDEDGKPLEDADPRRGVVLADSAFWRSTDVLFCGARIWYDPNNWFNNVGFRVISHHA